MKWIKASYSGEGDNCIEVARDGDSIAVRDSKDKTGPILRFTSTAWREFLEAVKTL